MQPELWNRSRLGDGRLGLVAASLLLALAAASPAEAQPHFVEQAELEFGTVASGQSTGPVSVAADGAVACGAHTCLGGQAPARFMVTQAESRTAYSLNYSTGDVLTRAGGGGSIPLQNLADDVGGVMRTNSGGVGRFRVGGEIVIGPSTPGGTYTGTYTILLEVQ